MPSARTATANASPTTRSRVSNGATLFVEGADGRSAISRRYRDIMAAIVSDLGGDVTEAQTQLIRRASALAVWCESQEAKMTAGAELDVATFSTAVNALRRLLADLGLERKTRDITPDLRRYIEGKAVAS